MNKKHIALYLFLSELGLSSIENLSDRIKIQKAVFLLQNMGINLNYNFSWYIRGPYSTELTHDYYNYLGYFKNNVPRKYKITDKARSILNSVQVLLNVPDGVDLDDAHWTELISSVAYFSEYLDKEDALKKKIRKEKPILSKYFEIAYNLYNNYK